MSCNQDYRDYEKGVVELNGKRYYPAEMVEEKLTSSDSDYMAAIRCIKEYCQSRPDSTMIGVFRVWCEDNHRLKALMEQEKEQK